MTEWLSEDEAYCNVHQFSHHVDQECDGCLADPMVTFHEPFSPDRVCTWSLAAQILGVTPTPVPTFPVRVSRVLVQLADDAAIDAAGDR
jgi:hypothetical protein